MKVKLTERETKLVIAGFMNGYERGHNDTAEVWIYSED